ncbi:hypothetical protein ACCO45_002230 [Purpureocillium lilacinum]|uniref:Uncharacterized protein n=1 Tax=Purpureocillium lilacinum TaxID=33203 RepID=A0ACC4E9U0_PURLI
MVLAINLADECRVAVPFEEMQHLKARAKATTSRLSQESTEKSLVPDTLLEKSAVRKWASDFPEPTTRRTRPGSLTSPLLYQQHPQANILRLARCDLSADVTGSQHTLVGLEHALHVLSRASLPPRHNRRTPRLCL